MSLFFLERQIQRDRETESYKDIDRQTEKREKERKKVDIHT